MTNESKAARRSRRALSGLVPALALSAALALPAAASGGSGGGGSTGTFPYPTYTPPGVFVTRTSSSAQVNYVDNLTVITAQLDSLYLARGCSIGPGKVNVYRYWFCPNAATHKTDEIDTTAAAMDVTATNPYRSRVNFTLLKG